MEVSPISKVSVFFNIIRIIIRPMECHTSVYKDTGYLTFYYKFSVFPGTVVLFLFKPLWSVSEISSLIGIWCGSGLFPLGMFPLE